MADEFSWKSLIPTAAATGGALLGNYLNNKSQNAMTREQLAQQQRQFDTNQQFKTGEANRRNMMQGMAAPGNLRALGYRDSAQLQQMQGQIAAPQGSTPSLGSTGGSPMYQYSGAQGSNLSKGIGLGGGLGSIAAGAAFGGPAGAAVAGIGMLGSAVANKVGSGRRAANGFVDSVENPFGADLATIRRMIESGDTQGATAKFQQSYQGYKSAANQAIGMGGKDALVAQQSLANPKLQDTVKGIAQTLGIAL